MKKNSLKIKIYRAIFCMLLIVAVVVIGMISYKYVCENMNEKESQDAVTAFSNIDFSKNVEESKKQLEYKGYKVIGIVKIPKINIEYPILDIGDINPESAKAPMKISIIKYWGEGVNDYGNLSIAGYNNKSGTMFGKTKNLKNGDIVELTDLTGQTIKYSIYDIFATDPKDVSILLPKDKKIREVTLITCTNGNKQRLILKAREI
ncbi:MAG: sortase [Clostridia bacterium]